MALRALKWPLDSRSTDTTCPTGNALAGAWRSALSGGCGTPPSKPVPSLGRKIGGVSTGAAAARLGATGDFSPSARALGLTLRAGGRFPATGQRGGRFERPPVGPRDRLTISPSMAPAVSMVGAESASASPLGKPVSSGGKISSLFWRQAHRQDDGVPKSPLFAPASCWWPHGMPKNSPDGRPSPRPNSRSGSRTGDVACLQTARDAANVLERAGHGRVKAVRAHCSTSSAAVVAGRAVKPGEARSRVGAGR